MNAPPAIFNRKLLRLRRDQVAAGFGGTDFLKMEMAARLAERVDDMAGTFPVVADLGCHTGQMAFALSEQEGIELLVQCDLSLPMLQQANGCRVQADEELLPFRENSLDLVVSCMALHWVNDLPGTLAQIYRALKPGGLFLASLLGGGTLKELRAMLAQAETEQRGGISPRVSPFVDVKDAGALLQRAGFALPVADSDTITATYENAFNLMTDLRDMGEANALAAQPRGLTSRRMLLAMAQEYQKRHGQPPDGRITATFEIITLTGMKPS